MYVFFFSVLLKERKKQTSMIHTGTPGRMIDLLRNSLSIHVDDVEVLILDEADRLLDEGFKDEIHELVKFCPKGRQTLLFSATFSDAVDELVKLSLNRPVRVAVDKVDETTDKLQQEFVRVFCLFVFRERLSRHTRTKTHNQRTGT